MPRPTSPFSARGWLAGVRSEVRGRMGAGDRDAFNAVEAHADGSVSVRTGFVPIAIAGLELPTRTERDRIENRDVYSMGVAQCSAEAAIVRAAIEHREKLRAGGVRDVIVLKERGATSFEEWAHDRLEAIARRLLYGR